MGRVQPSLASDSGETARTHSGIHSEPGTSRASIDHERANSRTFIARVGPSVRQRREARLGGLSDGRCRRRDHGP